MMWHEVYRDGEYVAYCCGPLPWRRPVWVKVLLNGRRLVDIWGATEGPQEIDLKRTPYGVLVDFLRRYKRQECGLPAAVPAVTLLPDYALKAPAGFTLANWPEDVPIATVPELAEAAAQRGITAYAVTTRAEAIAALRGELQPVALTPTETEEPEVRVRWEDVAGCEEAKRVVEIAAAGGHDIMLFGPPGTGKSLLAKAMRGILPPPEPDELAELQDVLLATGEAATARPVVFATQNVTKQALIGGGSEQPYPGLVSKAHGGVLVAEELLRWPRSVMNALLTAMQDGKVVISRAQWQQIWPARFQLFGTANPVPRDLEKMSDALRDRIDLYARVERAPGLVYFRAQSNGETTERVAARVRQAYELQKARGKRNAWLSPEDVLENRIAMSDDAIALAAQIVDDRGWSGRRAHQMAAVARTIADLAASETVGVDHIAEAAEYCDIPDFSGEVVDEMNRLILGEE